MQTDPQLPNIRDDAGPWVPRPTLSGADYTSVEVYDDERERIWWGDWICVGRAEEVPTPGDHMTRDIAGESIFITRNAKAELRAFYNVCSHRGTRFVDDGAGHVRRAFKCPYHAWTYDLDGLLIGTPNVKEDEHFDRSRFPLHPVHVDSYAGFVFVNMAAEPRRTLMEALTQGAETITAFERFRMDELRVGVRLVYEVEANWKIVVENYNECLHCPTIHPELVQVVPLFRFGEVWDEDIRDDGNRMMEGATSFTATGTSSLPPLPGLAPEDHDMYYGTYEFPNLMLNLHPDCAMYYIGYPKGPTHTTVVSEYLFRPETIADPAFAPEPVVEFWDTISEQDWTVCARAQTGVGSRAFTTGVYPRQDRFLYWFNEEYRAAMGRELQG
ncbi:MAG: aromatic ring-hydroxylating dioxygenase subunit alpha [Actinobacteria bacterium]|nr:aromatic ring-hydroxylating dioxygenase subunit alpha [Actinomycetota bacterium]